jgi:hypothetical protein
VVIARILNSSNLVLTSEVELVDAPITWSQISFKGLSMMISLPIRTSTMVYNRDGSKYRITTNATMTSIKIRRIFFLAITWLSAIQVVGSLSMNRGTNHKLSEVQNNNDGQRKGSIFPRKEFFSHAANLLLFPAVATAIPGTAYGASPVTVKDTDSLAAIAKRKFRQKPPKVLRRKLSMDFAVLLMRSSYNALDTLDCVAMVRDEIVGLEGCSSTTSM